MEGAVAKNGCGAVAAAPIVPARAVTIGRFDAATMPVTGSVINPRAATVGWFDAATGVVSDAQKDAFRVRLENRPLD